MKKLIALAMAGMLTFSCGPVTYAAAEDENTIVLDMTMMDENAYEGSWISAFDVFDVYLPNDWVIVCNGEEGEKANEDTVFTAQSEDGSRYMGIDFNMTDYADLTAIYEDYEQQENVLATHYGKLNEIPVVSYLIGKDGTAINGVSVLTEEGGMYSIYFISSNEDEEFNVIGKNILCSICVHEDAAETEEVAE